MKKLLTTIVGLFVLGCTYLSAQEIIPLDTNHWEFFGENILEEYKGKNAVYNKAGFLRLKDRTFLNGTIEFDLFLKEAQMFPGVMFRADRQSGEQFFLRPHLSGKPDANQAAPSINGITPFQLYFGSRYSFPYEYKYDDWTHVKVVVNGKRAQVFLDYSEKPHLSWELYLEPTEGQVIIKGGRFVAVHIADVKIDPNATELVDFKAIDPEPIEGVIPEWEISDMFEEEKLKDIAGVPALIEGRTWGRKIQLEEGRAANIARQQVLRNGKPGNTVFAKLEINSSKEQTKLFHFGYSDRVVAILNGKPIYSGNNRWRSRDYRYLGTIGLFDAIYLPLKKGKNELLMAVSEDFGGWLITGKFEDESGIKVK